MAERARIADREFDVIVIGGGGAGMAAAVFAAIRGLSVLLIEKSARLGGTTALSAGSVWIPNTRHAAAVGVPDTTEAAATYLRHAVGNHSSEAMRRTFLENGPAAVAALERHTAVAFRARPHHPDYLSDLPGSVLAGRAIEPLPFDGRRLGKHFAWLHEPLPEFTILGGMMVDRDDIRHLLSARRRWQSFRHSVGLVAHHARDRLRFPRGTRLVMGNALCGRLLLSLLDRQVPIWRETTVESLAPGPMPRLKVQSAGRTLDLAARRGVILATGGFNHHPALRRQLIAAETHSAVVPENSGDAIALALAQGARLGERHLESAFLAPMSLRRRRDGSTAVFPHFVLDRGKPGFIAVDGRGQRFVDEATSYHVFARAMYQAKAAPCFLIADRRAVHAYGMGTVRPGGFGLKRALAEGYVSAAPTLAALAAALAIDATALSRTIERFNAAARRGEDPLFDRGRTAFDRNIGDPAIGPNPCLAPLETPPFYALRLHAGDIAGSVGLVVDEAARVLAADGAPIAGLYACGNDMDSVMGGVYPGPGITLGPALTFAYLAARHLAGEAARSSAS